jgi:hypothetical protein
VAGLTPSSDGGVVQTAQGVVDVAVAFIEEVALFTADTLVVEGVVVSAND